MTTPCNQTVARNSSLATPERVLIRWGMEVDNVDAQRFYHRPGATLRTKILADLPQSAYADLAAGR
jgi:hypothetical protein